jgi:transposase
MTSYTHFIGIDIAKDTFVSSVYGQENVTPYQNNLKGFKKFLKDNRLDKTLVVMEFTGGYEKALGNFLMDQAICIYKVDPKKAHHFHKSLRLKGKTDKIDAKSLARYAYERQSEIIPETPLSKSQERLKELQARREDLISMQTREKNRKLSPTRVNVQKSCDRILKALEKEIERIDQEIKGVIDKDQELREKKEVLQTIDGVGEKVAHALLACLPELGQRESKQIASLCGLAPHPKDSGEYRGKRCIAKGGRSLKSLIFMAAMAASRHKTGILSEFYNRLVKKGKEKKVSMVAVARKIVVIANARIRDYYRQTVMQ